MRRLAIAAALLFGAGCVPQSIDLAGKDCDPGGGCAEGFSCFHGKCLTPGELEGRECLGGETEACGLEVGLCRPGVRTCQPDGKYGACEGSVAPEEERCDGLDNDCDGLTDEGLDDDHDGFGPEGVTGCPNSGIDCDDDLADVHAGAVELCNGVDDDCDGTTDEGLDDDHDGFGPEGVAGCPNPGVDCDDGAPEVHPGAAEECNGVDDDCDGPVDEGLDDDHDGFGPEGVAGCPSSGVDCDDGAPEVHPGALETCNGVDDDCSGAADESFGCVMGSSGETCSYVGAACVVAGVEVCSETCAPACVPPLETCNGLDDDCDGTIDSLVNSQATQASTTAGALRPSITGLGDGGFLAIWEEPASATSTHRRAVVGRFSAAGQLIAKEAASPESPQPLQPSVNGSLAVWIEPHGNGPRVHAAPLALASGELSVSASQAVSSPSVDVDTATRLSVGVVGSQNAVLWREQDGQVSLQPLTSAGAASGNALSVGSGTQPALALDESLAPARAMVAFVNGEAVKTRTASATGTGFDAPVSFGSGVVGIAASGGALARLERGTTDSIVLRRLDGGATERIVLTGASGSLGGVALGRVGDSQTWLVAWTQPHAAGGEELAVVRATWTSGGWLLGPVTALDAEEASSPAAAGDAGMPALAYVHGSQVFVRPLCP